MRAAVESLRRHPFAAAGVLALVGLLVAGVLYSDPPTSDDRNRPRLPPPEEVVTPSVTSPSPTPTRLPTPGPTSVTPTPTAPTSAPFSLTPGPENPSELALAPLP